MSKAEERALERFPVHEGASKKWIEMHLKGVCAEYIEGYHQAEKDIIGNVRSILNKIAYRNNGLDVNGDYCEQPYVELDDEFRKLLKEE